MTTTGPKRSANPPSGLRIVFLVVLGMWLLFPVLVRDNLAQDALPYVVAGELARDHPEAVYAPDARDLYDLPPAFSHRSCELSPAGTDCANLNVAFVSPPPALPLAMAVAALGPTLAVLLMRLVGAAALAGGMYVLWWRLAPRHERAPAALVATAVLLTPFVLVPVPLGQTSPLLFLSACLGLSGRDASGHDRSRSQGWAAAVALLWVLTVALKVFPVALVVVLLWQRRRRILAWSAGGAVALVAVAAALVPTRLYSTFVSETRVLSGYSLDDPYNTSLAAAVHAAGGGGPIVAAVFVVALAGVGALAWFVRRADDDVQWAWAWSALLLFVPLVWWHYLWLAVAAVGVTLGAIADLDERRLYLLPGLAAVTVPLVALDGRGGIVALLQLAVLVAVVVGVPYLTRRQALQPH